MKKSELRQIIREEIQRLDEGADPTVQQMMSYLKKQFGTSLEEADMIEAMYWFASDYHSGQASKLYRAMGEIKNKYRYRPNPFSNGIDDADDAVQMAYDELDAKFG